MPFDAKQYAEELLKEAGADDATRQAFLTVVTSDKVSKKLSEGVLMHADYSRQMDELRKKQAETQTYYASLLDTTAKNQQVVDQVTTENQRYKAQYGDLDPNGDRRVIATPTGDFISKKEYEEELKRRDANYIGLLEVGLDIVGKHMHEFKEPLNIAELKKVAIEKNLSLQQAYDQMIAPRRADLNKAQLDEQLKQARAEGAREFASTHKIPIDQGPREYHPIFDRDPKKQVGAEDYVPNSGTLSVQANRTLRDNFVEEWNKAGAASTSSQ